MFLSPVEFIPRVEITQRSETTLLVPKPLIVFLKIFFDHLRRTDQIFETIPRKIQIESNVLGFRPIMHHKKKLGLHPRPGNQPRQLRRRAPALFQVPHGRIKNKSIFKYLKINQIMFNSKRIPREEKKKIHSRKKENGFFLSIQKSGRLDTLYNVSSISCRRH